MITPHNTLQGMIIRVGEIKYTLPITTICQSLKTERDSLIVDPNGNEMIKIHDNIYNLVRLYEVFSIDTPITNIEDGIIILLEKDGQRLCVLADDIIGEESRTIHPLPNYLTGVDGIAGCSILDDDEIYLIIDISVLFSSDIITNDTISQNESTERNIVSKKQELFELSSNKEAANRYFTFEVASEQYGIDVVNIKEIIGTRKVTALPNIPDYVDGIISLRGEVIPVINVRKRFQKTDCEFGSTACIIVVSYREYTVGLVIDCVKEVIYIEQDNIVTPPSAKANYNTRFISKIGKVGDEIKQLLDLDNFLLADWLK